MSYDNFASIITKNAVSISVDDKIIQELINDYLAEGEKVMFAFKYVRDLIIFTNLRYIFVNLQKKNGQKIQREFYLFKHLTHFSTENCGGMFDGDHDIFLSFFNRPDGILIQLNKKEDLPRITKFLSHVQMTLAN